jgi:hypothetical protein
MCFSQDVHAFDLCFELALLRETVGRERVEADVNAFSFSIGFCVALLQLIRRKCVERLSRSGRGKDRLGHGTPKFIG